MAKVVLGFLSCFMKNDRSLWSLPIKCYGIYLGERLLTRYPLRNILVSNVEEYSAVLESTDYKKVVSHVPIFQIHTCPYFVCLL
jgi:hypothetical protein